MPFHCPTRIVTGLGALDILKTFHAKRVLVVTDQFFAKSGKALEIGRRVPGAQVEIFDQVVERFIKTGVMPTMDIQTSNDDPATSVGRSTKIYNNCILDGDVLLSMFNAEGDFVEQSIEG